MAKIIFIGTGAFASALASVLSYNNHKIVMWGINDEEIIDINKGFNKKYFQEKEFNNTKNIRATNDLESALKNIDYLVLAVPSNAFEVVIPKINKVLKNRKINVLNVAKGIDSKTKKFYSDALKQYFGSNLNNLATLVGPSFAVEVFNSKLTMVNVVGEKKSYISKVASLFENEYFKAFISDDVYGAQLFASLKNVYAIGMGILRALTNDKNPEAALLTLALNEIRNIKKALYKDIKVVNPIDYSFAAIGDTFLTCTSEKSRNFTFGLKIKNLGIEKALESNKTTIEGYRNALIFKELLTKIDYNAPFLDSILEILFKNKEPNLLLDFIEKIKIT
ncbi:NAD(P)H-dependent glycerol-3-phosphate dehydrogenase [Mycoplasmopsis meleagridis]|uniref:NAD(P)H-dependent glycerol-3-phosphate dehydrogenase n=1 Tax=Mycoplasmopsis meleagridis TaxID=29561 RepID=UPI003A85A9A7